MARTYRWLGGIGYILGLIPYVSFISSILVAVAWIKMGRDTREKVFTALGVLLIALFAAGIIMAVAILMPILALSMGAPTPLPIPPAAIGPFLGALILVGFALLIMLIAAFILDIAAHFKAAKIFGNKWFKLGGWLRIGTIIALVISIPLIVVSALLAGLGELALGGLSLGLLLSILWPLVIVVILSLLATIFSIMAFFTIPEEAP